MNLHRFPKAMNLSSPMSYPLIWPFWKIHFYCLRPRRIFSPCPYPYLFVEFVYCALFCNFSAIPVHARKITHVHPIIFLHFAPCYHLGFAERPPRKKTFLKPEMMVTTSYETNPGHNTTNQSTNFSDRWAPRHPPCRWPSSRARCSCWGPLSACRSQSAPRENKRG